MGSIKLRKPRKPQKKEISCRWRVLKIFVPESHKKCFETVWDRLRSVSNVLRKFRLGGQQAHDYNIFDLDIRLQTTFGKSDYHDRIY